MASHARRTKREFDEMYALLLRSFTDVEEMTPSLISQRIQGQVHEFFEMIYKQLRDIEKDVL